MFGGGNDGHIITSDLDLCHTIHGDRYTLHGIYFGRDYLDGHDLQADIVHSLQDGPDESTTSHDDAVVPGAPFACLGIDVGVTPSGDDQDLVRPYLFVAGGVNDEEGPQNEDNPGYDKHHYKEIHSTPP